VKNIFSKNNLSEANNKKLPLWRIVSACICGILFVFATGSAYMNFLIDGETNLKVGLIILLGALLMLSVVFLLIVLLSKWKINGKY
jgi:biotin transporter BioY